MRRAILCLHACAAFLMVGGTATTNMKPILAITVSAALICAFFIVAAYKTLFLGRNASEQLGED